MASSPVGTGPEAVRYSTLCSMNTTGFGSRMAACSRPLASAGLDGITTLSPGVCAYHASWLWECWAAAPVPEPNGSRTTRGR